MDIKELCGEILTNIDIDDDYILLTTVSGRKIQIFHYQDCCESVSIESVEGNIVNLTGKVLIDVSERIDDSDNPPKDCDESWTRTIHTFKTNDETVIVKWIGISNGYYSENVTIEEIGKIK